MNFKTFEIQSGQFVFVMGHVVGLCNVLNLMFSEIYLNFEWLTVL